MMLFNNKPIDNKEYSEDILNEGLSIYEVCRVFRGKVIFLNDNLLRLDNSIKKSNLAIDLNSLHVADQLNRLIQLENIKEGNIKYVIRVTPTGIEQYVYQIKHSYPTEEAYQHGVDTVTCHAIRENAEVKYINSGLRELSSRKRLSFRNITLPLKTRHTSYILKPSFRISSEYFLLSMGLLLNNIIIFSFYVSRIYALKRLYNRKCSEILERENGACYFR